MRLFSLIATGTTLLLATTCLANTKSIPVKSKISKVILYRSQALITRTVTVPATTGELALLIDDLPKSVVPTSLFASSGTGIKVRSVRCLSELVPDKKPSNEIAKLEAIIKQLHVDKQTIDPRRKLLKSKKLYLERIEKQYLSKLGPAKAALTDKNIEVVGFKFDSISKMTEFLFSQQDKLTTQTLALAEEERKINSALEKTELKLAALHHGDNLPQIQTNSQSRRRDIEHKAIIYVGKTQPKPAQLSFSYLVKKAGWSPAYNMFLNMHGDSLNLEYLAHVFQTTGESWDGVNLTLSTATPNMNAEIPILAPMWVHLTSSAPTHKDSISAPNWLASNIKKQSIVMSNYRQEKGASKLLEANLALNKSAWARQGVEFRSRKETLRRWHEGVRKIEQQMAVEYIISDTVTLASRNDRQMVVILSQDLPCQTFYEAVPLLGSYVSRGVEAKNSIAHPLLAGTYSAFINDQYVGAGQVPVTATGQTLVLGFGIDPQLRCRRELADKIADKSWGSRTESYFYKLILDNYKSTSVNVRLLDRIPVTKDKGLKITLLKGKDKLCVDKNYIDFDLPKGILRWDLELPPASSGANATTFEYSFDMTFDSDMRLSGNQQAMQDQIRNDLIRMKRRRKRK